MSDAAHRPMATTLGTTGIASSALALGCSRIGSALTPLDARQCMALIAEAYELGVRHFDTASIYGQGDSERLIARALGARRAQVCLASKAGQRLAWRQALMARFKGPIRWLAARRPSLHGQVAAQRAGGVPRCFAPDFIERSLMASLARLRTDRLDIFYLHSPDPAVLRDPALCEPLFDRLQRLRERGLFRALGVSCDALDQAAAAAGRPGVEVVQFPFDDAPASHRLLADLQRAGQLAVLRGLMPVPALAPSADAPPIADLTALFTRTLRLPAVAGLIVGTLSTAHLRDNVAAVQRAMAASRLVTA